MELLLPAFNFVLLRADILGQGTFSYDFNAAGNLNQKWTFDYTTTQSFGTLQNSQYYGYDQSWPDLLISYNGMSINYNDYDNSEADNMGNPLAYGNMEMSWIVGRQLQQIIKPGYY